MHTEIPEDSRDKKKDRGTRYKSVIEAHKAAKTKGPNFAVQPLNGGFYVIDASNLTYGSHENMYNFRIQTREPDEIDPSVESPEPTNSNSSEEM